MWLPVVLCYIGRLRVLTSSLWPAFYQCKFSVRDILCGKHSAEFEYLVASQHDTVRLERLKFNDLKHCPYRSNVRIAPPTIQAITRGRTDHFAAGVTYLRFSIQVFLYVAGSVFFQFRSLWPPCGIRQVIIFLNCGLFLLSFFLFCPRLSGCRLDVHHTSTHGVALVRI